MKIKLQQCDVGRFNLLSNDETLSFYMAIVDDSGKAIVEDGIAARIHYSGDAEEQDDFSDYADAMEIGWLYEKCLGYAKRVFGSTDYEAQSLLFAKLYMENFDELKTQFSAARRSEIQQRIESLQKQLAYVGLSDEREGIKDILMAEASKYEKWIESSLKTLSEYKDGSPKTDDELKLIERYQAKAKRLNAVASSI